MKEFKSSHGIGEQIKYDDNGFKQSGIIVAIRFTKVKTFYEVASDIDGRVEEVESTRVKS